jgi:polysaccharide export outer membrane protein
MAAVSPYRLLAILLAASCFIAGAEAQVSSRSKGAPLQARIPDSVATTPSPAKPPGAAVSEFTLGIPDVIRISVWKNPELSQTVTIGPDGFISITLLGDVRVAGMTTDQLSRLLTDRFGSYIVNPQVTVSVVEIHSRQVYVMGQVAKPGGYPILGATSVLQILAEAGGLSTFANRKGIYVLRSENGHVARHPFNYANVIHGKGDQNLTLQPGDTVVVP